MKKSRFLCFAIAVAFCAHAFAQGSATGGASGLSFGFTQSTLSANAGDSFNATLTLSGTTPPANITGYDVYLLTDASNSGYFTIQSSTPTAPFTAFGPSTFPDAINQASSNNSFVINGQDLGYTPTSAQTPTGGVYTFTLQTLNISIDPGTPAGIYNFYTSTFTNAGELYGDVGDSGGLIYTVDQGTFSLTVASAAVPEPATWSLLGLGGIGSLGLTMLRRRRA